MKQSVGKPRSSACKVIKAGGSKTKARVKRKKKLDSGDKVRAVMVAALVILLAAVSSLALMYFDSQGAESSVALAAVPPHEGRLASSPPAEEAAPELMAPVNARRESAGRTSAAPSVPSPPVSAVSTPANNLPPQRAAPAVQPAAVSVMPAPPSSGRASAAAPSSAARDSPVPERSRAGGNAAAPRNESAAPERAITRAASPPPPVEMPVSRGSLVFVIDDAGHNMSDLEPFLKFPGPLTIAVLPGLPHSAEAAARIRASGKEVFLHQPMEPLGGQNPGPGAIRAGMPPEEIRAILNRNLDEIWPVAGMNNHEGSRVSMDEDAMTTILSVCRERGIVFLDSRTTAETRAPAAARRLGMVIGERDVFIDNIQDRASMESYIESGLLKASQKGSVIMIGHVWSPDLAPLLSGLYQALADGGYSFSPASGIISGKNQ